MTQLNHIWIGIINCKQKNYKKKKRQLGLKQQKKLRLVGYTDEVVWRKGMPLKYILSKDERA